jgi:hypothetical protein
VLQAQVHSVLKPSLARNISSAALSTHGSLGFAVHRSHLDRALSEVRSVPCQVNHGCLARSSLPLKCLMNRNSRVPAECIDCLLCATAQYELCTELILCCRFPPRHNALAPNDVRAMLDTCNAKDIDDLMNTAMPKTLPRVKRMNLGMYTDGMTEAAFLEHFKCAPRLYSLCAHSFENYCACLRHPHTGAAWATGAKHPRAMSLIPSFRNHLSSRDW